MAWIPSETDYGRYDGSDGKHTVSVTHKNRSINTATLQRSSLTCSVIALAAPATRRDAWSLPTLY